MQRPWTLGFLLLLASFTAVAGFAQTKASDSAKDGQILFNGRCQSCHAITKGDTRLGPSLHGLMKRKTLAGGQALNQASVTQLILKGKGTMPGYQGQLSSAEMRALMAYLRTL